MLQSEQPHPKQKHWQCTNQLFIIAMDKGGSCLRNKRFIKHLRDTIAMDREDAQPDPPYMNTRGRRRNEKADSALPTCNNLKL